MTMDEIFLPAPQGRSSVHAVFFITGNPGLVGYYKIFLHRVHESTNALRSDVGVAVYARSLAGFEVEPENVKSRVQSVEDEIGHVQAGIDILVERMAPVVGDDTVKLTLMGHSFGTWLTLRNLESYHAACKAKSLRYEISASILLFPTVMDIAKSPSGRRLGWPLSVPLFPLIGGKVTWASAQLFSAGVLRSLLGHLPDFRGAEKGSEKDQIADTAVHFLKSRIGVEQCLSLANEEMRTITEDRFGEEIWGSAATNVVNEVGRSKLFFYFGSEDNWVANKTRDALIATRAFQPSKGLARRLDWQKDSRPWMEIDEHGTGHDFSMGGSAVVVTKVTEYMDIVVRN